MFNKKGTMKCEICSKTLQELFLRKIKGTYIKDAKGKKHVVCFECQKRLGVKEAIFNKLWEQKIIKKALNSKKEMSKKS